MLIPALLLALLAASAQDPRIPADTEVVTTPSGLAYSVLAPGTGELTAGVGDRALVHFTGWLADGTCFETTRGGKPLLVEIGRALPGWNEGLQLMRVGARYKFTVPPDLAYGAVGRPPRIPSNATLVFEVELV
jgi:FKBP-type peptidyl-prolyl cis-trans isomerase FkpA